jgi:hypothetical protein
MWLLDANMPVQLVGLLRELGIAADSAAARDWSTLNNGSLVSTAAQAMGGSLAAAHWPAKRDGGIVTSMSKLEALEKRVSGLSAEELAKFRQWFAEYDAAAWDRQIERDAEAGKLDSHADEAVRAHAAGKSTEF